MKVGNLIGGLEVVDVKRVNKLNLIQFLKEVDNYLHQGYHIDVTSARQVGLVLMADLYKTEQPFGSVESTDVNSTDVDSVEPDVETAKVEETSLEEDTVKPVAEATEQSVESAVKEEEVVEEEAPVAEEQPPLTAKKTTTRSKKTAQ